MAIFSLEIVAERPMPRKKIVSRPVFPESFVRGFVLGMSHYFAGFWPGPRYTVHSKGNPASGIKKGAGFPAPLSGQ
jgi:hypothetical protein